jgi:hypothetical protein
MKRRFFLKGAAAVGAAVPVLGGARITNEVKENIKEAEIKVDTTKVELNGPVYLTNSQYPHYMGNIPIYR